MFGDRTKAQLCAACAKKSMERAVSAAKFTAALHQVTEGEFYSANRRRNADLLVFWRNECGWMRCGGYTSWDNTASHASQLAQEGAIAKSEVA